MNDPGLAGPALAFFLTVTMEWAVLAWFSGLGFRRTGLFNLCLNGATWGTAMGLRSIWPIPIVPLEIAIILAEAALIAWYWRWKIPRAFTASVLMNLTSWLLGTQLYLILVRWI